MLGHEAVQQVEVPAGSVLGSSQDRSVMADSDLGQDLSGGRVADREVGAGVQYCCCRVLSRSIIQPARSPCGSPKSRSTENC